MQSEFSQQCEGCLGDESRLTGWAKSISFPESEAEAAEHVRFCAVRNLPITVQGSRTGLCGGAVPEGGHILNLSRLTGPVTMRKAGEQFLLTVGPGLTLAALRAMLRARRFDWAGGSPPQAVPELFWPPDPSETTASIGGIISTNGRGPGAFKYGSAARHVESLRLITARGDIVTAKPGGQLFQAAVGGEGLFGAVCAITLTLSPKPVEQWGVCFFFDDEARGAAFVDAAKALKLPALAALDFMDEASLKSVAEFKKTAARLKELPDAPGGAAAAIYMEIHAGGEAELEEAAGHLMTAAEKSGGDPENSWSLAGDEMEKLRLFRHAVPESINAELDRLRLADPGLHKCAADFTWPQYTFSQSVEAFRKEIEGSGLRGFIFGHASGNHLHVNLFPENQEEQRSANDLMAAWLNISRQQGGRLFREHGVGKVKKIFYADITEPKEIEAAFQIKQILDPAWFWNPGNKFLL